MSGDHIVVGVDGSSASRRALDWAIDLARDLDAALLAVHAAEIAPAAMFFADASRSEPEYEATRRRLEQIVREDWCRPLLDAGVPFEILVEDGGPALVLMSAADRAAARTIVVGPRGDGGSSGLPLGSVGLQLAQYANRPVTIVRTS
jgi:nucleotide-binding universal stress UspA family protein